MYYETKEGDNELYTLFHTKQVGENEDTDDEDQSKAKKPRKRRRNETSILEQENDLDRLSNSRPKRAAAIRTIEISSGQRRIDEFIAKKRSPKKNPKLMQINSVIPSIPLNESQRCPICEKLISKDILEVHTNACVIQTSDAAKQLIEKSKQRTRTEAIAKEALFHRATRKNVAANLVRTHSETTTCPQCGMQMTVSRLENQHKKTCSNRLTSA